MVDLGVFLPVCNNGYLVSTTAPQYAPSYAMNKAMTLLAEDLGFRFVLSPVKYRGFGGPTAQWEYVLESFELMAALAAVTDRIQLYGSVALPTMHPAMTAHAHGHAGPATAPPGAGRRALLGLWESCGQPRAHRPGGPHTRVDSGTARATDLSAAVRPP